MKPHRLAPVLALSLLACSKSSNDSQPPKQPPIGDLSQQRYRSGAQCAGVPAAARRTFPTRVSVRRAHQDDGRTPERVAGQWRQSSDSWVETCDLYTGADRSVDPLLADAADVAVFICINSKDGKPYGFSRLFYPSVDAFIEEAHVGKDGAYVSNVDKHVYWDEYGPYPDDFRDDQHRHTLPNSDVFASLWQDTPIGIKEWKLEIFYSRGTMDGYNRMLDGEAIGSLRFGPNGCEGVSITERYDNEPAAGRVIPFPGGNVTIEVPTVMESKHARGGNNLMVGNLLDACARYRNGIFQQEYYDTNGNMRARLFRDRGTAETQYLLRVNSWDEADVKTVCL